jgi:hypothetical protein
MKLSSFGLGFAVLVNLAGAAAAQTSCGLHHTKPGTFICNPNPSENPADAVIPALFHLSAQANAPNGGNTRHYGVFLDNQLIYDNRLATATEQLSIEINLLSPSDSGSHSLRLMVSGVGSTEVKDLKFRPFATAGFCEPLSRVETFTSCYSSIRTPLHWTLDKASLDAYPSYVGLYARNLKSLEADVADAVAVDAQGNVYVASHLFGGLEIRKYAPDRSVVYDSVVPVCGPGSLSVSGIAADEGGHVWVAGNTTACLAGTQGALKARVLNGSLPHGFVLLLDTSKPTSTAPVYLTYLAEADNQIAGLRVDGAGNAYVVGAASSVDFPHQSRFDVNDKYLPRKTAGIAFIAVLNASGSGLQWGALLDHADLSALALDAGGNVFVAGRTGDEALLAELSDHGKKLSYLHRLGQGDPRAVAVAANGAWAVVELPSVALAVAPCAKRIIGSANLPQDEASVGIEVSAQLALDAFAKVFSPAGVQPCGASLAHAPACCDESQFAVMSAILQ